jgi:hypothetical protein
MDRKHVISGLFWLAVSIFVGTMAVDLGLGTFSSPGSGFIFFWSSVGLGSLSVLLIIKSILGERQAKSLSDLWKGLKWGHAVLAIIVLFLYALLLTQFGFIAATFVLMVVLFGLGKPPYWIVIAGALVTTISSLILFHFLLKVQFPKGVIGW